MREFALSGRHKVTDGFRQLAGRGWRMVRWLLVGGAAVAESRGCLRQEVRHRARLTTRGGTVDARDHAHVKAIGPVHVFARDHVHVTGRRTPSGAPVVRKTESVHVSGSFDAILPLAVGEEHDEIEDVLPLALSEPRPASDE